MAVPRLDLQSDHKRKHFRAYRRKRVGFYERIRPASISSRLVARVVGARYRPFGKDDTQDRLDRLPPRKKRASRFHHAKLPESIRSSDRKSLLSGETVPSCRIEHGVSRRQDRHWKQEAGRRKKHALRKEPLSRTACVKNARSWVIGLPDIGPSRP